MNQTDRDRKRELLSRFKKPTDLPLKQSGIIAEVVPVPMAAWIEAGEVPEALFGAAMSAVQTGPAATAEALNLPEMFGLALKVARGAFRWPKLTPENENGERYEEEEDTLNPATLPLPDLAQVLQWGLSGTKDATVQTDSGEISAESLHSFRQNGIVQSLSADGGQVQTESGA